MRNTLVRTVLAMAAYIAAVALSKSSVHLLRTLGLDGPLANEPPYRQLTELVVYVGITLLLFWLLQVRMDRRPFDELGLSPGWRTALREGGLGWLAGGTLMAAVLLAQWGLGVIRVDGSLWEFAAQAGWEQPWWAMPISGLFLFAGVALGEELLFRGYLLQAYWREHGLRAGAVGSATVFSLLHFINPGFNLLVFVNILLAGILFTLMVLHYGNLWFAMGYHLAWNWVQINLISLVTPEHPQAVWIFRQAGEAAPIWLGGEYWPEGSLLVTLVNLALIGWFGWRMSRRARKGGAPWQAPRAS